MWEEYIISIIKKGEQSLNLILSNQLRVNGDITLLFYKTLLILDLYFTVLPPKPDYKG